VSMVPAHAFPVFGQEMLAIRKCTIALPSFKIVLAEDIAGQRIPRRQIANGIALVTKDIAAILATRSVESVQITAQVTAFAIVASAHATLVSVEMIADLLLPFQLVPTTALVTEVAKR